MIKCAWCNHEYEHKDDCLNGFWTRDENGDIVCEMCYDNYLCDLEYSNGKGDEDDEC